MFEVKAKIWLERDSQCVVGEGRAELLHKIQEMESLSEAAQSMDMAYSHAWSEIKEISKAAGGPVVEASRGGRQGGSSHLTPLGKDILETFEKEKERVERYLYQRNRP